MSEKIFAGHPSHIRKLQHIWSPPSPNAEPSGRWTLVVRLDPLILDLRRRCGSFINCGQAKSANFCVNRNSPVTSLTDFCLRQGVQPSARSKPPQERGLWK